MQKALQGITVNGQGVEQYLQAQFLKDINEVSKGDKIYVYKPPMQNRLWSPYRGRCSKVRKIV